MTRRPIKSRGAAPVQAVARWLTTNNITPNQISQASVAFAALACMLFWMFTITTSGLLGALALLLAALATQLRLLCNLLDGIVAVEGGKGAPDGPFWNEAPDRLADLLILTGLGIAAGSPVLGMTASALAISTAYIRELGRAEGMQTDFSGPLAKPQRMAVVTIAALLAMVAAPFALQILNGALYILVLGTALTAILRSRRLIGWLKVKT